MNTRQNVVHVKECECWAQVGPSHGLPIVTAPCRESYNASNIAAAIKHPPTLAQAREARAKLERAEQHIHSLKYILRLEARVKDLEARVESLHDKRCPRCWWPMHSASVPCR